MDRLEKLLTEYTRRSEEILKGRLAGIYLHGSAAMGCFTWSKSDVDLIVVVNETLPDRVKKEYIEMVTELNGYAPPKGIEMSIVQNDVCNPFVYPTPYELHFSSGHLGRYREDPDGYIRKMNGTDKDLAAHFMVINRRGRCLCGAPIEKVFAEVPGSDYLDSILFDVEGAAEEITENPLYLTLNLARVLAYKEEKLVLSKKEGGDWALKHLPSEYHLLIMDALYEYSGEGDVTYDADLSGRYAAYMLKRIRQ